MEGTQMEMFNFLWLILGHYLPLTPTKNNWHCWHNRKLNVSILVKSLKDRLLSVSSCFWAKMCIPEIECKIYIFLSKVSQKMKLTTLFWSPLLEHLNTSRQK